MKDLNKLADSVRAVQDWERKHRFKTPKDEQILAFYDQQLALLAQADSSQDSPVDDRPSLLSRFWSSVTEWLHEGPRYQVLGVASTCAVLLALVLLPERDSLTFSLSDGNGRAISTSSAGERDWLAAVGAKRIAFSDGTSVTLAANSDARVQSTTRDGASLELRAGNLRLDVVPRDSYNWEVAAGAFSVRVKGTVFDVAWDPATLELDVQVERGAVAVSGGPLQGEMLITKGQRLVASQLSGDTFLSTQDRSATEPGAADELGTDIENAGVPGPSATELAVAPEFSKSKARSARVLRATDPEEDSPEPPKESADQLLRRADASRALGDAAQATELLLQVRQRFPGTSQASLAAYTLGVTAFMNRGSSGEGARWFQTYLRESPSGPLAREALGQLMEAEARAGNQGAARQSALRYLELYPSGPHRHAAQVLTGVRAPQAGRPAKP